MVGSVGVKCSDEHHNRLPCEGNHMTEETECFETEKWTHRIEHDGRHVFSWLKDRNICTPDGWRDNQEKHMGWNVVEAY